MEPFKLALVGKDLLLQMAMRVPARCVQCFHIQGGCSSASEGWTQSSDNLVIAASEAPGCGVQSSDNLTLVVLVQTVT